MGFAETARGLASRSPLLSRAAVVAYGRLHGFTVRIADGSLSITSSVPRRRVIMSPKHAVYARDVIDDFDTYFDAVEPTDIDGQIPTVDYSVPRAHSVRGWDVIPIEFPSLAEPLATAAQYLEFSHLSEGQTVLDLGAYSGFTSLVFKEKVGATGAVIAVEADPVNLISLRKNIDAFRAATGDAPKLAELAVWSHSRGIEFISEGNMGSAAASLMQRGKSQVRQVPSATLSDLSQRFQLGSVDFIKADIEGAELEAFSDREFFRKQHPRIIFEGVASKDRDPQVVIGMLDEFGYECTIRDQLGSRMPLVECI
jgi:FkbM family methyltransferase